MPLTKVTSSLITSINATQIQTVAADAGKVLTSDGSTLNWVASSNLGGGADYTTVGNASAGIFASAVCFIPSSAGTGTWTAPAGVYTARVTIVGGGSVYPTAGGRSHFNYAAGTSPGANQMYAAGGLGNGAGGAAGWNSITVAAGQGASGGGGYGGGGGTQGGGGSYGTLGSGGIGGDIIGGSPQLSYAACKLTNFAAAIAQNPGRGYGGGGWCSAIVSVTPGTSYAYSTGAAAGTGASYGMVVIEW